LYKRWLQLLDEGLGDGFDVVPGAFNDNDNDYDSYEYGDNNNNDDDDDLRNRRSNNIRQNRPPPSSSSLSEERRSQANAYESYIRGKLNNNDDDWTDITKEELEARRLLDDDFDENNPAANPTPYNRDQWFNEARVNVNNNNNNNNNNNGDDETFQQAWEDSKARKPISLEEQNYSRRESKSYMSKPPSRERRPPRRYQDFESDDI